jgi:predicted dehydrogenase
MKKAAVVGFGFMGKTHALNILKNENVQLSAIVESDAGAVERGLYSEAGNFSTGNIQAEKIREVRFYPTLEDCIHGEHPDSVHICVHTDLHYAMALKALKHGLHVLIEKPFVLDISQGNELIALAVKKGVVLMVAHVVRFMPPYLKLKSWIQDESFGKMKFMSLCRFSGVPVWGQWKEKQAAFGSSGGALYDLVVHDIDFALDLFGKPSAFTFNCLPGKLSRHDYIHSVWSYPDRTVKIEGGNIFHPAFPFRAGFMATFDRASVCYSPQNPHIIQISDESRTWQVAAGNSEDGYYDEISFFYQCIEKNLHPEKCMPQASLETIRMCHELVQNK